MLLHCDVILYFSPLFIILFLLQFNAPCCRIIERLLDYIEKGPIWRLHAFLRACAQTNQEHVVDLLGLDSARYTAEECEEHFETPEQPDAFHGQEYKLSTCVLRGKY